MNAGVPSTAPLAQHLGHTPVHDLDLAEGAHHHVGWLQVSVDHSLAVGIADRLAHLLEHRQEPAAVAARLRPFVQQLLQGPALDELHRQVRPLVGQGADLEHRYNAGVLEPCRDAGLVQETLPQEGIVPVTLVKDLDSDLPAERLVASAVDDAHPAVRQLPAELKAAGAQPRAGRALPIDRGGLEERSQLRVHLQHVFHMLLQRRVAGASLLQVSRTLGGIGELSGRMKDIALVHGEPSGRRNAGFPSSAFSLPHSIVANSAAVIRQEK
jgi:hypothetical protein